MSADWVTERELQAHLDPMKQDIKEMKADVKTLVVAKAEERGKVLWLRGISTRMLAWGALIAGAISPYLWKHQL